ncbi:hypothetical protein K788_0008281 (plasmid) [Paraburkholderia caribensis MBA4]|uniref:Uncharacterized protein n=1 Tax=Paraburkholderia caribensis MBA4 TaxID=1323664 RepID=A0A0P0RNV7_9BURK|nr:hypothetical protein K788_0008281 [Paraburkholderia caribensis MBA4]
MVKVLMRGLNVLNGALRAWRKACFGRHARHSRAAVRAD